RKLQRRHRDLIDASVPVMQQARDFLSESGTIMILTDATGVVLETEGDQSALDAAQDIRLVNGANWNELTCGTNAIGTALSARQLGRQQHRLEAGLRRLSKSAPGGLSFFDRKGRLVKVDAAGDRSLGAMGIKLDSKESKRVDAFDADSATRAGRPTLPEWLRPEWVEPVIRGGERVGTIVVLADPFQRRTGPRGAHSHVATPESGVETNGDLAQIIGGSPALRLVVEKARQLASLDVAVLLQGETGVGKEMFARAIHEGGDRKNGRFVALNCGGL